MAERPRRLVRDVDLALLEPTDQLVRRKVDDLDLGAVEHAVGHRLAHAHLGEAGDDVVEALDVLDVERGVDVDPGVEQFHDVLPALRMAAAFGVGVRELVHQRERGTPGEDRVDVHLFQLVAAIGDVTPREDLERLEQGPGLGAAVGFDDRDDDIVACLEPFGTLTQHLERLADARCRTEEDLELPARFALRGAQQGFGRGAGIARGHREPITRGGT